MQRQTHPDGFSLALLQTCKIKCSKCMFFLSIHVMITSKSNVWLQNRFRDKNDKPYPVFDFPSRTETSIDNASVARLGEESRNVLKVYFKGSQKSRSLSIESKMKLCFVNSLHFLVRRTLSIL